MIQRRKSLKRSGFLKRKPGKRIPAATAQRRAERGEYGRKRMDYLRDHPWCQIYLVRHGISEHDAAVGTRGLNVPRATQIHHRNKARGARLLDERWWMSCCREEHEWVENHKAEARELGLLLPIQANADGEWGSGQFALTTPNLIAAAANKP